MKIEIHRGQNQVGGNIVEIATQTTRILLDVGQELEEDTPQRPAIEGLFEDAAFDAVFITHYHLDHLGLAYDIDRRIPLYIGERSFRIVETMDRRMGRRSVDPAGFLENRKQISIGDITVTPFLCDHSAFDSYMLLCEADGERVLYTGDFRANGRKTFDRLLTYLPDKVDKLICEGTTLSRPDFVPATERELEEQAVALFRGTSGPVFVLQATTNIDRIVTMYRAAKRSGRVFLQGLPMAAVTSAIGESIPNPTFSDVFVYKTAYEPYEELAQYHNRMGKARMENTPFVMCVRSSMLSYLKRLSETVDFTGGVLVYSMWSGYREKLQMQMFLDGCTALGIRIETLHTTGHADAATIRRLIEHTHPDEVLPIHTERAEWFVQNSNGER